MIRGMTTQFLIFHLPIVLEYQKWYEINAKMQPEYIMVLYLNYLIIIFMNIKENIRDMRKSRKHNGVYFQNY